MYKENSAIQDSAAKLQKAFESGNTEDVKNAFADFGQSIADKVREDFVTANGDKNILAKRGFRVLTSNEEKYWNNVIKAGKSANPKQELTGLLSVDGGMPETIIEDVYRDLTDEHPLLSKINFVSVKYLTRWILNDHTAQTAVWGPINSEITEEITSSFRSVELTQCKLSAYAIIDKDMLALGPIFLDGYVRTFLKEALAKALENSVVTGTGKNMPIGFDRNISESATVVNGVYPKKEAIEVTSFMPKEYGTLLATLAEKENGSVRSFSSVLLICNQVDYLTKIMPATTVLSTSGNFVNNLFPFPTDVVISNELTTGEAIIALPNEYFMGIGSSKEGALEYSDDVKFLEDQRVFKAKMFGMGKAYDNTCAIRIDISNLDPAYITVKNTGTTPDDKSNATPTV